MEFAQGAWKYVTAVFLGIWALLGVYVTIMMLQVARLNREVSHLRGLVSKEK